MVQLIRLFLFSITILINFNCVGLSFSGVDSDTVKVPYHSGKIIIDGRIDDWKTFGVTEFSDTANYLHTPSEWGFDLTYYGLNPGGILPPKSRNKVKAMYSWKNDGLYIAFHVEDQHLMAEIKDGQDSPNIFLNDGLEVYIDSRNDSKSKMDINDYQFIVDILSNYTVFKGDRSQQDSLKITVPKDYGQNIFLKAVAHYSGSLNDSLNKDAGYVIELRIPFEAIGIVPETGMLFKMDLCNNDNDYFLKQYDLSDIAVVITRPFNWSGLNNFGFPDYWKTAKLIGGPDWFDKASLRLRKEWLITIIILGIITFTLLFYILLRLKTLKHIPAYAEVSPSQILFIKQNVNHHSELTVNQKHLQKATDYILDHCKENISSEDVANHLSISLRKFQMITKEELNCTPTSFIYIVKLNKASEYIKNNQGNIAETAYQFGFSSPSYFTKIFKNHFGVTPLEYKKNENSSNNSENSSQM